MLNIFGPSKIFHVITGYFFTMSFRVDLLGEEWLAFCISNGNNNTFTTTISYGNDVIQLHIGEVHKATNLQNHKRLITLCTWMTNW